MQKYRLTDAEVSLVIAGLEAGAREKALNADTAQRLGYSVQASQMRAEGRAFQALATKARSNRVTRLTARLG